MAMKKNEKVYGNESVRVVINYFLDLYKNLSIFEKQIYLFIYYLFIFVTWTHSVFD